MRKLILAFALACPALFAALPADAVFEVRPTNGSNLNGGAYAASLAGGASVDYSQQDAAQLSITDLVNVGDVATVTSVAGSFTDAMQGNFLHLESGTNVTPGFYAIVTFTDANTIVLDRSPGNTIAAGVGKIGGATKSLSGQTTTTLAASLLSGHKVWIKNEAWNESVTGFATIAANDAACVVEGYNTTRGDEPTGTSRPTNDRGAAGVPFTCAGGMYVFKHLVATDSNGVGWLVQTASGARLINCRSYGNVSTGFTLSATCALQNCEADLNTTTGVTTTTSPVLFGCYIHDNTTNGFSAASSVVPTLLFCIIETNASHGLSGTTGMFGVYNCTINGNTGVATDGINMTTPGNSLYRMFNTIISNNGDDGVEATDGDNALVDYNNFYGNAGSARVNFPTGENDIALDPTFTNAAGGNFAVGTNMKAAGFPGLFPSGTSTGYLDIGAVQRQEGGGATSCPF